ncbi:MAG: helix-turn-helix transcriptional regulator [Phycisphaerales bacterium]
MESLDAACRVVRGFVGLPLFPTRSWCIKAVARLAPLFPDGLLSLSLVEDHSSRLVSVPVTGVACGEARARRWNAAHAPAIEQRLLAGRWKTLAAPGAQDARIVPVTQIEARSIPFEPADYNFGLLACSSPCGTPAGRRLVLHVAFDRPHRASLAVVQVVMSHLADLAAVAFPGELHYGILITDREEAVVGLLMQGLTVPAISKRLGRSPHTIHDHIKKLHAKTGVRTRGELVARALGHAQPAARPVRAP